MKTLLMTAIAAVFTLQVQAQFLKTGLIDYILIDSSLELLNNRTINDDCIHHELQTIEYLNSLPKLDTVIFSNSSLNQGSAIDNKVITFEYNADGLISSFINHSRTVTNKNKPVFLYENGKIKSIEGSPENYLQWLHVFEYDGNGDLTKLTSTGDDLSKPASTGDDFMVVVMEFNKDKTVKSVYNTVKFSESYSRTINGEYKYDDKGRIIYYSSNEYFGRGKTASGGFEATRKIYKREYKYIETTESQPLLTQIIQITNIDSVIVKATSTVADSAIVTSNIFSLSYKDGILVSYPQVNPIDKTVIGLYNIDYVYSEGNMTSRTINLDNSTGVNEAPKQVNFTYDDGNIIQIKAADRTTRFIYQQTPKSTGLKLNNNQTITISFNYPLDATADVKSLLAIREPALKADLPALAIQRAYVNPTNAKELVIELNRPLEVREGFELYSTQDLPLKDGRFVPVSLVAQGSAATGAEQNVSGEITVLNDNGTVTVSAPQGIASAAMYSVAGMLVAAADGGNASEATISVGTLSAGMYYVHVTDAYGNTSVQPVAIGK